MYGWCGSCEDRVDVGALHDLAGVHHHDLLGHLGDDAEVVGDEHDRHPVLFPERFISSRICAWIVTSSAVVGSSAISSSGLVDSAIAIITRWRMPPESWCGYALARRLASAMPTCPSISIARSHAPLAVDLPVELDRLRDLVAHRVDRVERRHGLLEDHRDGVAADVAHLVVGQLQQVAPVEPDLARDGLARALDQPHRGHRGDALAAAGLADDAQRLAVLDLERHAVHGADDAVRGEEMGPETA